METLGALGAKIIAEPESSIGSLKTLREFANDKDNELVKWALLTQLAVYKDILPGYKIRQLSQAEQEVKVSKEVKAQRQYEQGLLTNYHAYLASLESIASKNHPGKGGDFDIGLLQVIVNCLGELLTSLPHFNFRVNLITSLVQRMRIKSHPEIIHAACCFMETLFENDETGEASFEAARVMSRFIKLADDKVHGRVIQTFLKLRILEDLSSPEALFGLKRKRDKREHLSKRQRKALKAEKEVQEELKEAETVYDREEAKNRHTEILKLVFATYFRILKRVPTSPLLSVVLEGLAQFGRLISVDFFGDLISVLKGISLTQYNRYLACQSDTSSDTAKSALHCIIAAFELLNSLGNALNVDLKDFFISMYAQMVRVGIHPLFINETETLERDDIHLLIDGFQLMFGKTQQVPVDRVAAFVKRLSIGCLHMPAHGALASLTIIKGLFHRYSKLIGFLESDGALGMGVYSAYLDDPDLCNPFCSTLWEMGFLAFHHSHPAVRDMAKFLLSFDKLTNATSKNPGYDASLFLEQSPLVLYARYNELNPRKGFHFTPSLTIPSHVASLDVDNIKPGHILKSQDEESLILSRLFSSFQ